MRTSKHLALPALSILVIAATPTIALATTYLPEASHFCTVYGRDGSQVKVKAAANANIGNGGDWWFSGTYIYTTGDFLNMVGFGVIENHSGTFGTYWKRAGLINIQNGAVSLQYPQNDPNSNNADNLYRISYDAPNGRYRCTFNATLNNESCSNLGTSYYEEDAGVKGVFASTSPGGFSIPQRVFTYWRLFNAANGQWVDPAENDRSWHDDLNGVTWNLSGFPGTTNSFTLQTN